MRALHLITLFLLVWSPLQAFSAPALSEADKIALQSIVAYGQSHYDAASGLMTNLAGQPEIPLSAGYVAACLATGQDTAQAHSVLAHLLATQFAAGSAQGLFPWQASSSAAPSPEATLYAAPLLAYIVSQHAAALDAPLAASLKQSLLLSFKALEKKRVQPADDARFLLHCAARATLAAALKMDTRFAASEVSQWLRLVTRTGLPAGHSPTFDALKYVSLKWIWESLPQGHQQTTEDALLLTALDLASRLHEPVQYLAGAMTEAFAQEYRQASGFASYVLYTDFGSLLPAGADPYFAAAVLPHWRAPKSVQALRGRNGMRRTRALSGAVRATDTYLHQFYSLGTMSGTVGPASLPIFITLTRSASPQPTMYFYCEPTPCTVQAVQADNLALCSFNFDGIGTAAHPTAQVCGILGSRELVREVYCYGVPWNGEPTAIGELESVAVATDECYVGITLTRTGPASSAEGVPAKPAVLSWSAPDSTGVLLLRLRARLQDYPLPRPLYDLRAGVVIELASRLAYPSLADFVKHISAGRLKQFVKTGRERLAPAEKSRTTRALVPKPQARGDRPTRLYIQQTLEYTIEGRTIKLTEDLLTNQALSREIDGTPLDDRLLWGSEIFSFAPGQKLSEALQKFR